VPGGWGGALGSSCRTASAGWVSRARAPAPPPPASDDKAYISAFATANATADSLRVFLGFWGNPEPPAGLLVRNRTVRVVVTHAAGRPFGGATLHVIDAAHANPQATWFAQGSPDVANATQRAALLASSEVGVMAASLQTLNATATAVTVEMGENSAVVVAFAAA
jgi:hypothetical protein